MKPGRPASRREGQPFASRAVTNQPDVMENEQLTVQRAIDGDQGAMRALWTRHAPHVDVVVRRLVGQDPDLAADIAQEVWIQIFRALPNFRGEAMRQIMAKSDSGAIHMYGALANMGLVLRFTRLMSVN